MSSPHNLARWIPSLRLWRWSRDSLESVEFQWERVGTDEDCQSVVEDISAGEYQLTVGMGEQTADPVSFELQ